MKSKLMMAAACAVMLSATAASAAPSAAVTSAVADKSRPAADVALDPERKPAEMLEFAGVKPGQTVVDLIPGGGYFTRIFAKAVGEKGTVYAVSGPPRVSTDPAKPTPTPPQDTLAADATYGNIKSIHVPFTAFAIPTKADVVWTAQNYHDVKNIKEVDIAAFDKAIYDSLKPGGIFVVLDHTAAPGAMVTNTLHRIDPAVVKKEVEAVGFKYEGESKILFNADDDHTKNVFDPSLRHKTDQFIYKFRKPK